MQDMWEDYGVNISYTKSFETKTSSNMLKLINPLKTLEIEKGETCNMYIWTHASVELHDQTHARMFEVRKDNNNALHAYHKMGFYEAEDRDEKYLMKKEVHKS